MGSFLRKQIFAAIALAVGAVIAISAFANDAWDFINLGLSNQAWMAIGAAIFFVAVATMLYQYYQRIEEFQRDLSQVRSAIETDPELTRLRGKIAALTEAITNYEPFEHQQDRVVQLYESIKYSEHTAWARNPAKQLRRDFLNSCGWAISNKKHFESTQEDQKVRGEISSLARELEDYLDQQ